MNNKDGLPKMMRKKMTYTGTGVDYGPMDQFKRMAQKAALTTVNNVERLGFRGLEESYGESAFLMKMEESSVFGDKPYMLAHVEEGLGTKNLIADAMYRLTGKSYYDHIAQDTIAMIVNDLITTGALPLSVAMHLAVGDSSWFKDKKRCRDLIRGWKKACDLACCVWGGGETPTLKGIIVPETAVLAGSATGIARLDGGLIAASNIRHNDAIVFIESSGIHANGLSMAREIAEKLSKGYLTKLCDGRTYGETLLDPTHIYVRLVEDCIDRGADIHYAVNITGHGWRKLMRAKQSFAYIIEHLPRQQPIFDFLQEYGPIDDREAYSNLNMGAGFALYVPKADVNLILEVATSHKLCTFRAGYIERSKKKKVVIKPKGLEYTGATLGVR